MEPCDRRSGSSERPRDRWTARTTAGTTPPPRANACAHRSRGTIRCAMVQGGMQRLASYLHGAWSTGAGATATPINPATEAVLAEVATGGHDLGAAFQYSRTVGSRELALLTFAQRGNLL